MKHSSKAQASEWVLWIPRVIYVIAILVMLLIARESLLRTKTDISQTELNILTHTLLQNFPPDMTIKTSELSEIQKQLDKANMQTNKKLGIKFAVGSSTLFWREQDYKDLAVKYGTTGLSKEVIVYNKKLPATIDGKPAIMLVGALKHAQSNG